MNQRTNSKSTPLKGSLMLLLATFFWGTTFVAQTSAAELIPTFTFNAMRSYVGAAFLGILLILKRCYRTKNPACEIPRAERGRLRQFSPCANQANTVDSANHKHLFLAGILCGVILFAAMYFQQGGISNYPEGVASSGRAGFLTATYVILVAICSRFLGKKMSKFVYVSVVVCIFGMYLLCLSGGFSGIYFGDIMEMICAICFTVHILVVDHFSDCDSISLCCIQFLTVAVLSTISMAIFDTVDTALLIEAIGPILYAGILSSGIAYTLQIEGQKYSEPAVASVIMSLESVFAALGGWILLAETLSPRETLGCALVFIAVLLAQIPGRDK